MKQRTSRRRKIYLATFHIWETEAQNNRRTSNNDPWALKPLKSSKEVASIADAVAVHFKEAGYPTSPLSGLQKFVSS